MRVYLIDKNKKRNYNERDKDETIRLFNQGHFNLVADAMPEDLEETYSMTQNHGISWINNPDIISYATDIAYTRSTMIGDVFLQGNGIERKFYVVASCGFERLEGIDV